MEMEKEKQYGGICIFGILFIITSLLNITTLLKTSFYIDGLYGHWPKWAALLRYSFSWFQRILGLSAGIGLIYRKEVFRKLALVVACFTIATINFKHPYGAFSLHAQRICLALNYRGYPVSPEAVTMPALIITYLIDICFDLSVIYYFTRSHIKEQFIKKVSA